jgi:hypothetical protein
MSKDFKFIVTVTKRDDLEHPTNATDAAMLISELLEEGSLLNVVSVNELVSSWTGDISSYKEAVR